MAKKPLPAEAKSAVTDKKLLDRFDEIVNRKLLKLLPAAKTDMSWSRMLRILFTVTILLAVGYFIYQKLKTKPINPIYAKVESIKRIRELRLVKHHYESIIPITKGKGEADENLNKRKEKLQFLLVAPVEISSYIDLGKMKIEIMKDSLLSVDLPQPELSEVYVDLKKTYEYTLDKKSILFGKTLEKRAYNEAYEDIARALYKSKIRVSERAIANHILIDARKKGENYIRSLFNSFGYRVEFINTDKPQERQGGLDLLRERLDDLKEETDLEALKEKLQNLSKTIL